MPTEVEELRAQLEVAQAATEAAVSKARWQAVTNAELNMLHDELRETKAMIDRMHDLLRQIGDRAHDASTGPAVPDVLWEIRSMAYDGIGA